jgi:hypothetical protein
MNIVLIIVFAGLLWLPTLDVFFQFDHTPAFNEKRVLAPFPDFELGPGCLKKFIRGFESYFNDHFGFRNQLIFWHVKWTHDIFRNSTVPKVLIGKDGWLFWAGDQMAENYRGIDRFTPQELRDWQTLLERRRDWLARYGIKYIFVVAPDKQSIYPEYLPDWLTKVRPESKLDQFFAYMRANSTVDVLDLRPVLRDAKKIAPTYFRNDAHWNLFGGFIATEEIIQVISRRQPELKPLSIDSFEIESTTRTGGDLAMFLGLKEMTDDKAILVKPKSDLPVLEMSEQLEERQGKFFTKNPNAHGNAMIFRDSFAYFLEPFLGYHFAKVSYIWRYELNPVWIEADNPVVVISEMVERNFNVRHPKELMTRENLK